MPTLDDELDLWDFELPDDAIARHPSATRDASRLLHVPLAGGPPQDHQFSDLPSLLREGDLLVANNTRVMAARLRAHRASGGAVQLLCLSPGPGPIEAMIRPARRIKIGEVLTVGDVGTAEIVDKREGGIVVVRLSPDPVTVMSAAGEIPLPPYLHRDADASDTERYQTVYAGPLGAAAAPTAGLHFTEDVFAQLAVKGVRFERLTLHVGLGTFRPLREEDLATKTLHAEPYTIPESVVEAIRETKANGGRVIAVGTTSLRALESALGPDGLPRAGAAETQLFLKPPDRIRAVDGMITNFHLPRSSLLMLVACLVGRERLLDTYRTAISRGYRFYSYGDSTLLL